MPFGLSTKQFEASKRSRSYQIFDMTWWMLKWFLLDVHVLRNKSTSTHRMTVVKDLSDWETLELSDLHSVALSLSLIRVRTTRRVNLAGTCTHLRSRELLSSTMRVYSIGVEVSGRLRIFDRCILGSNAVDGASDRPWIVDDANLNFSSVFNLFFFPRKFFDWISFSFKLICITVT